MFSNPIPLSPENHRGLCYSPGRDYAFAADLSATPILSGEADHAAREYVLVFPREADQPPRALLGSDPGVNAYVGRSPNEPAWLGRYIPAHLRRYPFLAGGARDGDDGADARLTVAIDQNAPQLGWNEGERLFTDTGEPTPTLERIQQVLKQLHHDFRRTQRLVRQLDDAGLLIEQEVRIEHADGQSRRFTGVRLIDMNRVDALDPVGLKDLHDSGALALVHAHRISLTNLEDSVLAKRSALSAKANAPAAPGVAPDLGIDPDDSDTISFEGIGDP